MWEFFAEDEKDSKYVKCKESIKPTVARGGDEPRSFSTMIQKNHPKNHHPSWFLKFSQKLFFNYVIQIIILIGSRNIYEGR